MIYVSQTRPYLTPDTGRRRGCRNLEFDLKQVERVHAQDRDDTCTQACNCMVLDGVSMTLREQRETYNRVGRKVARRVFVH